MTGWRKGLSGYMIRADVSSMPIRCGLFSGGGAGLGATGGGGGRSGSESTSMTSAEVEVEARGIAGTALDDKAAEEEEEAAWDGMLCVEGSCGGGGYPGGSVGRIVLEAEPGACRLAALLELAVGWQGS